MKIYRYWESASETVPGQRWDVVCFGGSNDGPQDAGKVAQQRAKDAAMRLMDTSADERIGHYLYAERPLREELKEEFRENGEIVAAVTRNAYGSLVLNTSRVMFIDLDMPNPAPSLWGLVLRLFGIRHGISIEEFEEQVRERVRSCVEQCAGLGLRLYRTFNGFRCLVTSDAYYPSSDESFELLKSFGCDPLYMRMCRVQECYRARLTPKCWRCGMWVPRKFRFPWGFPGAEQMYRQWESEYEEKTAGYTVCRFIGDYGSKDIHPQAGGIIKLHDGVCCREGLPLA